MKNNNNITEPFKKDNRLEKVLTELNEELEDSFSEKLDLPKQPIILIMGCARSGSTLMLQYLSEIGLFSYPSNLIARFYKNPYLGIKIQQALLDFDPLNQLDFKIEANQYSSNLGKTFGALAPSEFWYFWRQYFDFSKQEENFLDAKTLANINSNEFIKMLSAFEVLMRKPLVMKGMMLNWNIPFLQSIYDKFIFINLKREVLPNAQSLLNARKKYFNNKETWYSFKPKEYNFLKDKTPQEQVIGQVYYTRNAVEEGLKKIPQKNKIDISYEEFCENPYSLIETLQKRFELFNCKLDVEKIDNHFEEMVFQQSSRNDLSQKDRTIMFEFYKKLNFEQGK